MRPPDMRAIVPLSRSLPWTRRTALEFWSRCLGMLAVAATTSIVLGAAFQGIEGAEEATVAGLVLVAALPAAWIGLARLAEKRYLSRPPKRFLVAALGIDFGGIALVAAAVVLLQSESSRAAPIFAAGGFLEGCGTLLLLVWFAVIRLVAPTADHMRSL